MDNWCIEGWKLVVEIHGRSKLIVQWQEKGDSIAGESSVPSNANISVVFVTDVTYPRLVIISKIGYQDHHQLKTRDEDPRSFLGSFLNKW